MPCVPQPIRRTAAEVSAVLGLVLLISVIILALSLPWSAAYGADTLSGTQAGAGYEPDSDEPPGGTAGTNPSGTNPPGPTTRTEEPPRTDPQKASPSTYTQPAPPGPSPTKTPKTETAEKTRPAEKKTPEAEPASSSGARTAPPPAGVTVAGQWEPSVLPAPDQVPSPGSVPRPDDASTIGGLGQEGDTARLAAAAAVPAPPRWPDQAFGFSLVAAGVISLAFSVGGLVVVALRRRRW